MKSGFNKNLNQIALLLLLLFLASMILKGIFFFIPGILGSIALYILSRASFFQHVFAKKRKPWLMATLYLVFYTTIIGIPFYLSFVLIYPSIETYLSNPQALASTLEQMNAIVYDKTCSDLMKNTKIEDILSKATQYIPGFLGSATALLSNFALMLFLLYFMLIKSKSMETKLYSIIPLSDQSKNYISSESKRIIKANALGLPIIAMIQGATAALGYYLFGIENYLMWGFITGIFSFIPVLGTFLVWGPLAIYLYASNQIQYSVFLLIYSILVTGNVDYFARIGILKKIGDAHPVITILGIIVGVDMFGFLGLIFGPLIVSYLVIFYNVYILEFTEKANSLPTLQTLSD